MARPEAEHMSTERVPLEIIALRAASLRALADLAVAEAAHAEAAVVAARDSATAPQAPETSAAPSPAANADPDVPSRPLMSWRAVSAVVGVSEDTLARRRKQQPALDMVRPFFDDARAAVEWFRLLCAPTARQPLTRSRPPPRKS
jgi:hypothetical protein